MKHRYLTLLILFILQTNINSHECTYQTYSESSSPNIPYVAYAIPCKTTQATHYTHDIKTSSYYNSPRTIPSDTKFAEYCRQHHYTEKEILNLYALYQYDSFITFAKTLPGYKKHIKKLYKQLQSTSFAKKCIRRLQGKHYQGLTKRVKQLYNDIRTEENQRKLNVFCSEQAIIHALNISNDQCTVADQLDTIIQNLCDAALVNNIVLHTDLETCLETAIDTIKSTDDPFQFIFNTALINHVACEIEDRLADNDHAHLPKQHNVNLLARALEQFVIRLNPITQVKNICQSIISTAHFVADITLGKLYLTEQEYQKRKNTIWKIIQTLSLSNFALLPKEQCIDIIAQCAADCVFSFGIIKVARYIKHLQCIHNANTHVASITQNLRDALDVTIAKRPILVTPNGIVIKSIKNIQKTTCASQKINNSQTLLTNIQNGFLAPLKQELVELHNLYSNTIKGFGPCANKYLKIDFDHIFGMEFDFKKDTLCTIKGFHHDSMHKVQQSNMFKFTNIKTSREGIYSTNLIFENSKPIFKTFFPANWTRKDVVNAICEAYNNFIESGVQVLWDKNGKCKINSVTNSGLKIEMYITRKGKIVSAYPQI